MKFHIYGLTGALVLSLSTAALAQDVTKKPETGADRKKATAPAQTTAPTVAPETPAQSQTTTTQSTTSTTAVPDATGNPVAVEKSTDTTQTTTTQPAPPGAPAQSQSTSTTTVAPDAAGNPTATTTTTTTQPAKDQTGATVTAATAADVKAGVPVFDSKGGVVGKVESVNAKGAVVDTGTVKAAVPIASFAKNDKGLVISMTKAQLDAAAKATTKTTTTKTTKKPK
jgi:hypothetical protein